MAAVIIRVEASLHRERLGEGDGCMQSNGSHHWGDESMSDFETHPVGTAARLAELEAALIKDQSSVVFKGCTFDLSGSEYAGVVRNSAGISGSYGDGGDKYFIEEKDDGSAEVHAVGLYILSQHGLDTRIASALTKSKAETAAAYERAAKAINDRGTVEQENFGLDRATQNFFRARDIVHALATPDHTAALDRLIAEAEARGMRKAMTIVNTDVQKVQSEMTRRAQRLAAAKAPGFQYAIHRADLDARISCRDKILAAISQGEMK